MTNCHTPTRSFDGVIDPGFLFASCFRCVRTEVYEAVGNLNGAACLGLRLNGNATLKEACKMPLHVIIFDH